MITFSSREVNQDFGRAKKATAHGPVIITDRGTPSHVLVTIDEWRQVHDADSVVEGLSCDDTVDDFEQFLPGGSFPQSKAIFY